MTRHVLLTDSDRAALQAARHDLTLRPLERDRVEMLLLADAGWNAPQIARHLRCHAATVRGAFKRFQADEMASLRRSPPGPSPDTARRQAVDAALGALLDEERTWTAEQLAHALAERHAITLSIRQTRKHLGRIAVRLLYLDECGFSPSQPVTSTWVRRGERKRLAYENPEGRRVNALVTLAWAGRGRTLAWTTKPQAFVAEDLVAFLRTLPPAAVPTVIILDNAGIHRSKVVRAARAELRARGISLDYLPPYSPELNLIEPVFRVIKYHERPARRYASVAALTDAIHAAFSTYRSRLQHRSHAQPGLAA